jgi:hypothetical protein
MDVRDWDTPFHNGLDSRGIRMATPVDRSTRLRRYKSPETMRAVKFPAKIAIEGHRIC